MSSRAIDIDCNVLPDVAKYWSAANEGRLLVRRCTACEMIHYYPRAICPYCLSEELLWFESPGIGEIYSYSTMKTKGGEHTLAYVRLNEGIVMMTNIVGCNHEKLSIGQPVKVVFLESNCGQAIPMFTPT